MMNRNEKKMIRLIREEYNKRILELFRENVKDIFEADMFDAEGNNLLSPGLKVRHKSSGYEYTVDHIEGDGDGAVVYLRHPETPRFKPPQGTDQLIETDDLPKLNVDQVDIQKVGMLGDDEQLPQSGSVQDPLEASKQAASGSLLKIDKKEFEKDYEVK